MSWSLQLKDGDLNPSGALGYRVVTGPQKLIQDLRGWILEPRGSDPLHPEYGSTLDGGIYPDGTAASTMIGETVTKELAMNIEQELRRVLLAYQTLQLRRVEREQYELGGKNTLAPGEALLRIKGIEMKQVATMVVAAVQIQSNGGQVFSFAQAFGG